jgi:hypothetical protein
MIFHIISDNFPPTIRAFLQIQSMKYERCASLKPRKVEMEMAADADADVGAQTPPMVDAPIDPTTLAFCTPMRGIFGEEDLQQFLSSKVCASFCPTIFQMRALARPGARGVDDVCTSSWCQCEAEAG